MSQAVSKILLKTCWKSFTDKGISPSNLRASVSRLQISTFEKTRLVTPRSRTDLSSWRILRQTLARLIRLNRTSHSKGVNTASRVTFSYNFYVRCAGHSEMVEVLKQEKVSPRPVNSFGINFLKHVIPKGNPKIGQSSLKSSPIINFWDPKTRKNIFENEKISRFF